MNPYKLLHKTNLILTLTSIILLVLNYEFEPSNQENHVIIILVILGACQLITSLTLTAISVFKNKHLLILYLIYWFFVIVFFWNVFNLFRNNYSDQDIYSKYSFYAVLIAVYNVFISNRSFSESEKNIFRL